MTNRKIGLVLLFFGALGSALSTFFESTILAFISLTLIFWGCLFLLVLHGRYVKSEVLDYLCSSSLSAIDKIISESNLEGKAIYIPVPKGLYLPYLTDIRNEFVYIPKRDVGTEEAMEQAFRRQPEGLRLTPPGLGLVIQMEKRSGLSFHDLDFNSLKDVLRPMLVQELEITDDFSVSSEGDRVRSKMRKTVCEDLCREVNKMQRICPGVGCPLSSLIACILTRVTIKPIVIESCSINNSNIETWYRILQ